MPRNSLDAALTTFSAALTDVLRRDETTLATAERSLAWAARRLPQLRGPFTHLLVARYANAAPPRPHPYTLADPGYTSWTGLSDMTFSARHLPPCSEEFHNRLPDEAKVVPLFIRKGATQPAADTTLLFPIFAQWFTDSFLRMDAEDYRKNQSNHSIDLIQIYGMGRAQTRMLRKSPTSKERGRLDYEMINKEMFGVRLFEKDEEGKLCLRQRFAETLEYDPSGRCVVRPGLYTRENFDRVFVDGSRMTDEQREHAFAVGLEHGNSTVGNVLMSTIFLREHNRLAGLVQQAHPAWDDDRVFETARLCNIVMLLKVVLEDYIPHISPIEVPLKAAPGISERQLWAQPNWMAVEFNLLYRWHGLIPDEWQITDPPSLSAQMVNNNALLVTFGTEELIRRASKQRAGRIGLGHVPKFLEHVEAKTLQVARQARLRSYNEYRIRFGLRPYRSFEELTGEKKLAGELELLYGHIDNLEYLVGLFAEKHAVKDIMGDLMLVMVAHDAFTHALTNPLLSKRLFNATTFSEVGMREIEKTGGIADIVVRNTSLKHSEVSFNIEEVAGAVSPRRRSVPEAPRARMRTVRARRKPEVV
jgi:prostaglandin-endoperoxide synthase 2